MEVAPIPFYTRTTTTVTSVHPGWRPLLSSATSLCSLCGDTAAIGREEIRRRIESFEAKSLPDLSINALHKRQKADWVLKEKAYKFVEREPARLSARPGGGGSHKDSRDKSALRPEKTPFSLRLINDRQTDWSPRGEERQIGGDSRCGDPPSATAITARPKSQNDRRDLQPRKAEENPDFKRHQLPATGLYRTKLQRLLQQQQRQKERYSRPELDSANSRASRRSGLSCVLAPPVRSGSSIRQCLSMPELRWTHNLAPRPANLATSSKRDPPPDGPASAHSAKKRHALAHSVGNLIRLCESRGDSGSRRTKGQSETLRGDNKMETEMSTGRRSESSRTTAAPFDWEGPLGSDGRTRSHSIRDACSGEERKRSRANLLSCGAASGEEASGISLSTKVRRHHFPRAHDGGSGGDDGQEVTSDRCQARREASLPRGASAHDGAAAADRRSAGARASARLREERCSRAEPPPREARLFAHGKAVTDIGGSNVTLKDYQALGNFSVVGKCEADVRSRRGDVEDVSAEAESEHPLVYRSSVRIMVRPETAARPRRASSEERNGHGAEAAGTDPEGNGSARRDSTIGLPHRAIVKEQFRLPGDLFEKMPSASNSPATDRRRRSRISSVAQSIQQMQQQVIEGQQQQTVVVEGQPEKKMRHQTSAVASMVQRFERERDCSSDRARTRSGAGPPTRGHSLADEGSPKPSSSVGRRWPPSASSARSTASPESSRSSSSMSSAEEHEEATSRATAPVAVTQRAESSSSVIGPAAAKTHSVGTAAANTAAASTSASNKRVSSSVKLAPAASTSNPSKIASSPSGSSPSASAPASSSPAVKIGHSQQKRSAQSSTTASETTPNKAKTSSSGTSGSVARAKVALRAIETLNSSRAAAAAAATNANKTASARTSKPISRAKSEQQSESEPIKSEQSQSESPATKPAQKAASSATSSLTSSKTHAVAPRQSSVVEKRVQALQQQQPDRAGANKAAAASKNAVTQQKKPCSAPLEQKAKSCAPNEGALAAAASGKQSPDEKLTSGCGAKSVRRTSSGRTPAPRPASSDSGAAVSCDSGAFRKQTADHQQQQDRRGGPAARADESQQQQQRRPATGQRKSLSVQSAGGPASTNTKSGLTRPQQHAQPKTPSAPVLLTLPARSKTRDDDDNLSTRVNVSSTSASSSSPEPETDPVGATSERDRRTQDSTDAQLSPAANCNAVPKQSIAGVCADDSRPARSEERDNDERRRGSDASSGSSRRFTSPDPIVSDGEDETAEAEAEDRIARMVLEDRHILQAQQQTRVKRSESDGIVVAERPRPDKPVKRAESTGDAAEILNKGAATTSSHEAVPRYPQNIKTVSSATIVKGPEDAVLGVGQAVHLRAHYFGNPEPRVTWLRNGSRVFPSDDRVQIKTYSGESTLVLRDLRPDDAGKYEVLIENEVGNDAAVASLGVEGPPEPPAGRPFVSAVHSAGASLTLAWYGSTFDGGSAVTGYVIEASSWPVSEDAGPPEPTDWAPIASEPCNSTSFVVRGLDADREYIFRVKAINVRGQSKPGRESEPVSLAHSADDDESAGGAVTDGHHGERRALHRQDGKDEAAEETGSDEDERHEKEEDIDDPSFEAPFEHRIVNLESDTVFKEKYGIYEELGRGRFGVVFKVKDKVTGEQLAAKFVRCRKQEEKQKVRDEIEIMNSLEHPKLLQLAAAYDDTKQIIMLMEYIGGGELFEKVVADDFALTERDCMLFMRQICSAMGYMHSRDIVHLDLKPENILCRSKRSHQIKIIDFGLTRKIRPGEDVRIQFGTPEFVSPEVLNYDPVTTTSDMWSVGVVCYVLLSGLSPFMGDKDAETFANITSINFDFEDEAFDPISDDAKDFIRRLLVKNPRKRLSAADCLEHPWLKQYERTSKRSFAELNTDKLKSFLMRRRWQKAAHAIRALGRFTSLGFRHDNKDGASSITGMSTQSADF